MHTTHSRHGTPSSDYKMTETGSLIATAELPRVGDHRPDSRSRHGSNRGQRRVAVHVGLLPLRHDLGGKDLKLKH